MAGKEIYKFGIFCRMHDDSYPCAYLAIDSKVARVAAPHHRSSEFPQDFSKLKTQGRIDAATLFLYVHALHSAKFTIAV